METSDTMKKTALHALHQSLGAKMVPFAGFDMPVRYSSDLDEHHTVRKAVGVFDVSHMGEFWVMGPGALDLIQWVTSNDASKLTAGKVQYSCLPNGKGGIVDDLLVYCIGPEEYMLVVNASNIEKDWNWIQSQNRFGAKMENFSDFISLLAVQGPLAKAVIQKCTDVDLEAIPYYNFTKGTVAGIPDVIISNTGYTGAGGFELYVPNDKVEALWKTLFEAGAPEGIKPIGLGARDTLRLEMGFCLYGNDIDDTTSPLEAGLGWITKFTKTFVDSDRLLEQKASGLTRKLVGFELLERGIARGHYDVKDAEGQVIGQVTSGTQSPTLGKSIGLAYVPAALSKPGSRIFIDVRGRNLEAEVVSLPFIKS
jgi:aminomethyltransferase